MTIRNKPTASLRLVEKVLTEDRDQLKALVKAALQEVLEAEMNESLGALPGQRCEGRVGYRAGYYSRGLVTPLHRRLRPLPVHSDRCALPPPRASGREDR